MIHQDLTQSQQFYVYPDIQESDSFRNSKGRVSYLMRLYFFMSIQLLAIYLVCYKIESSTAIQQLFTSSPYLTFWIPLLISLLLSIWCLISKKAASAFPSSLIIWVVHTIATSVLIGNLLTKNLVPPPVLIILFGLLFLITVSQLIHTLTSKYVRDFKKPGLIVFITVVLFVLWQIIKTDFPILILLLAGAAGIVFGFFLIWQNETIITASADWMDSGLVGSVAIYAQLLGLIANICNQLKSVIIKDSKSE